MRHSNWFEPVDTGARGVMARFIFVAGVRWILVLGVCASAVGFGPLRADRAFAAPPVAIDPGFVAPSSLVHGQQQAMARDCAGSLGAWSAAAEASRIPISTDGGGTDQKAWVPDEYDLTAADLLLDQLVARGDLSSADVRRFKSMGDVQALYPLLEMGKVSHVEFDLLVETYAALQVGEPSGPPIMISLVPRARSGKLRRAKELILWPAESFSADKTLVLTDPDSGKNVAVVDYRFKDGDLGVVEIDMIEVLRMERGQGYSDVLAEQLVREEPQARKLTGQLARTNKVVLERWLNRGFPLREAFALTPAYKSFTRVGFTRVSIGITEETTTKGRIIPVYEFEMSKP